MKYVYTIKISEKDKSGYHAVYIPDFDGYTQGADLYECIEMATDYITNKINCLDDVPIPTDPTTHSADDEYKYINLLAVDVSKILDTKSTLVRKNITIPEWLNNKAESKGINFSQTLKEALLKKIG